MSEAQISPFDYQLSILHEFWQPCLRAGAADVGDVPVAGVGARHRLLAALPLAHASEHCTGTSLTARRRTDEHFI